MKSKFLLLCAFCILTLTSFTNSDRACEYVGSNIEYITSQTQKALLETELNKTKYQTYKAINAIEKTKTQLNDCGCSYATKDLLKGLENLVKATKTSSINAAHVLLNRVLINTASSIKALKEHHTHQSKYENDVLTLNTNASSEKKSSLYSKMPSEREMHQKIDISLEKFETSLNNVISVLDCSEAKKYITKVQNECQQELFREDLSDSKRYYNLRTKSIATNALNKLPNCD
jgi:septal ring factor EnvC (AmiA/AmiB activator)